MSYAIQMTPTIYLLYCIVRLIIDKSLKINRSIKMPCTAIESSSFQYDQSISDISLYINVLV